MQGLYREEGGKEVKSTQDPKIRTEKHVELHKGNPETKRQEAQSRRQCEGVGADEPARHRGRARGQCWRGTSSHRDPTPSSGPGCQRMREESLRSDRDGWICDRRKARSRRQYSDSNKGRENRGQKG